MTTRKLNWLAVGFGTAGLLAAILTAAMNPALGASVRTASSKHTAAAHPARAYSATLRYIEGTDVTVPAGSVGENATKCPRGMYAIGGGPSSPSALWTLHWSGAGRSAPSVSYPNEWTVSLRNASNSPQVLKVFVVCSTAQKVSSNY